MRDEKVIVTYTCDQCGKICEKGDYFFTLEKFRLRPTHFYLGEWRVAGTKNIGEEQIFCSRACFDKFMVDFLKEDIWYNTFGNIPVPDNSTGEWELPKANDDYIKSVVEDCRKIIERQPDFDLTIVGKKIVAGDWISRRAWKEGTYIGWWGEHLHKCDSESQQNSRWFPTKQDLTATDYYIPYVTGNCVECKEKKCPGYYHAR